jgi:hypothetical protein
MVERDKKMIRHQGLKSQPKIRAEQPITAEQFECLCALCAWIQSLYMTFIPSIFLENGP